MSIYQRAADSHPKLKRGQVWCRTCGNTFKVDSATCLRFGWPECCDLTMTIGAPCEREAGEGRDG